MPSPFPGIDPYLENPGLWPDVHHELISVIREQLQVRLRPAYFVQVQERIFLSDIEDPGRQYYVPDVNLVETGWTPKSQGSTAAVIDESILLFTDPLEIHEAYLEVQDTASRTVITVIEVLSPSNKVAGSSGFKSYCEKREDVLRSRTKFVEIDLLRAGSRLPWLEGKLPPLDYLAHASSEPGNPRGRIWAMPLERRLKTIGVPLKDGEPDAPLDLQSVLSTVYDRAGYDLIIDYTDDPVPPLGRRHAKWTESLLKDKQPPPHARYREAQ